MNTNTAITDWAKLRATSTTASSITTPTITTTAPSGDGYIAMTQCSPSDVHQLAKSGGNLVQVCFFGAGADNATATARITGWRRCGTQWVPVPILALSLTLGTSTGASGQTLAATDRMADTITASTIYWPSAGYDIVSGADNTVGVVTVDARGCEYIGVQLAVGTATNVNALWAML